MQNCKSQEFQETLLIRTISISTAVKQQRSILYNSLVKMINSYLIIYKFIIFHYPKVFAHFGPLGFKPKTRNFVTFLEYFWAHGRFRIVCALLKLKEYNRFKSWMFWYTPLIANWRTNSFIRANRRQKEKRQL